MRVLSVRNVSSLTKPIALGIVGRVANHARKSHLQLHRVSRLRHTTQLGIGYIPDEDDIARELERARELLAKSQAKIDAKKQASSAQTESSEQKKITQQCSAAEKRKMVTTSVQEGSGLITTDGEMMARLSEEEEWEERALLEVFEDLLNDDLFVDDDAGLFFASTNTTKKLAQRDEVSSVRNLMISMNKEDFDKIFNKRNRWIGEQ